MAAAPAARLLIVNVNPEVAKGIGVRLRSAGERYRSMEATSRTSFFDCLERERPDLIVVDEGGIPDLPAREVLEESQRLETAIPVVVIGKSQGELPTLRSSVGDASNYVQLSEIDRLPSVVERSLSEQRSRFFRRRLQNEIERSAALMQENQRLVTIGRLAGSIAHEINNPLESVANLLFLMNQEHGLSPDIKRYLNQAQQELSRAVEISKQTLNFYREAPDSIQVRLSNLLEEVLVLYRRKISEKKLLVIRKFQREESIVAFPGEIRQVFSNLIGNAIEASTVGGKLYLHIWKSRLWRDSGITGMRATIADTGIGMTPEILRRIGEPFFTTKGQGGTGLGLWVSQSIIGRYGGSLNPRSSTGTHHGTVFSLFLPTKLRPQAVPGPVEKRSPAHSSKLQIEGSITHHENKQARLREA
jgi:two-component system NtrC family sensor kinase